MSINFSCPKCRCAMEITDRMAGGAASCVGCGQRIRVPEKASHGWVIGLVLGLLAPVLLIMIFCAVSISRPEDTNAVCPQCGNRFFISQRSVAENRDVPCFKCGNNWPAQMVYVGKQ